MLLSDFPFLGGGRGVQKSQKLAYVINEWPLMKCRGHVLGDQPPQNRLLLRLGFLLVSAYSRLAKKVCIKKALKVFSPINLDS